MVIPPITVYFITATMAIFLRTNGSEINIPIRQFVLNLISQLLISEIYLARKNVGEPVDRRAMFAMTVFIAKYELAL